MPEPLGTMDRMGWKEGWERDGRGGIWHDASFSGVLEGVSVGWFKADFGSKVGWEVRDWVGLIGKVVSAW